MMFDPNLPPLIVEDAPQGNPYAVSWKFIVLLQVYVLIAGAGIWAWWYWVFIEAANLLAK